jgi:hypothetical protein
MYTSKLAIDNPEKINPRYVHFISKGVIGTQKKVVHFTIEFHFESSILHWFYDKKEDRDKEFEQLGKNKGEQFLEKFEPLMDEMMKFSEEYFMELKARSGFSSGFPVGEA